MIICGARGPRFNPSPPQFLPSSGLSRWEKLGTCHYSVKLFCSMHSKSLVWTKTGFKKAKSVAKHLPGPGHETRFKQVPTRTPVFQAVLKTSRKSRGIRANHSFFAAKRRTMEIINLRRLLKKLLFNRSYVVLIFLAAVRLFRNIEPCCMAPH